MDSDGESQILSFGALKSPLKAEALSSTFESSQIFSSPSKDESS